MAQDSGRTIISRAIKSGWTSLDLTGKCPGYIPTEIAGATSLRVLVLGSNQLTSLPCEVCQLIGLHTLILADNLLTTLPEDFKNLSRLQVLGLDGNKLQVIPEAICRLSSLKELHLSGNHIRVVPAAISGIPTLTDLDLRDNQLEELPPEIGKLSNLRTLWVHGNRLQTLPVEVGCLTAVQDLGLAHNRLRGLPSEIEYLRRITALDLRDNRIVNLPGTIGQLAALRSLNLENNQLEELPEQIGELSQLETLILTNNSLNTLPAEIGTLRQLAFLDVSGNRLVAIPREVAHLRMVSEIKLDRNCITSLPVEGLRKLAEHHKLVQLTLRSNKPPVPPEILNQGLRGILSYFSQLARSVRVWTSKLLVVGEGGVGKTTLVRLLRKQPFSANLETTHGLEVHALDLMHPAEAGVEMRLNAWDFGGQQIYHATHQFFLTNRSLFVVLWNSRLGHEQGKLDYWLDMIKIRAPDSPVLVVATWIDERDAKLPKAELQDKYPQIKAFLEISSKTGQGVQQFTDTLRNLAADLPLMGEAWPAHWLYASEQIRGLSDTHISPGRMHEILENAGVASGDRKVLIEWLHELGDVLYYRENRELNDIVILKPDWATQAISQVLESDRVIKSNGVFTRQDMEEAWSQHEPGLQNYFLKLMEQFDLSYRTLEDKDISLVVERLSEDPPEYLSLWNGKLAEESNRELTMRFRLGSPLPPGVPTWFIARTHRFTTYKHWRYGALFKDTPETEHLGLVRAYPYERYIKLSVRGPFPQNFFGILLDGLMQTLDRFPGLEITRTIPCPGHEDRLCAHEFNYEDLMARIKRKRPLLTVECPKSFESVSVVELLTGLTDTNDSDLRARFDRLEWNTTHGFADVRETIGNMKDVLRESHASDLRVFEVLLAKLDDLKRLGSAGLLETRELSAHVEREFLRCFIRDQKLENAACPNVFVLRTLAKHDWTAPIVGQTLELQLYCGAPGHWHPTQDGGRYQIENPAKWLMSFTPLVRGLVRVMKRIGPLAGPALKYLSPDIQETIDSDIDLMTHLVEKLPDGEEGSSLLREATSRIGATGELGTTDGASLRGLHQLLVSVDPSRHWGGLEKVITKEGDYLWMCKRHAQEYR